MEKINKDLKNKAISIKGKDYVLVSDRILAFNEMYDKANIETEYEFLSELNMFIVKAKITTDTGIFTGLSQAVIGEGYINKTSALENAETSAVGRALGMMGIGVLDSVASADEINKATTNNIPLKENRIDKMKATLNKVEKRTRIKNFLDGQVKDLKTKEDYEEACNNLLGIELKEENYDKIIETIK